MMKAFILIAVKNESLLTKLNGRTHFELLVVNGKEFLSSKGFSSAVSVQTSHW